MAYEGSHRPLGPGSAAYRLPTTVGHPGHDPTEHRNPMYSFGVAPGYHLRRPEPGPCYRVQGVTRDGVIYSPTWTFGYKFPYRSSTQTPGPGAHAPERYQLWKQRSAPVYTMAPRTDHDQLQIGPGPAKYAIRFGSGSPAWTMPPKIGWFNKSKSPGPAAYFQEDQNLYRNRYPVYSLHSRIKPQQPSRSPGPAAYPPNLYDTKRNPSSYSFGIKHARYAPPMIIAEDTLDVL